MCSHLAEIRLGHVGLFVDVKDTRFGVSRPEHKLIRIICYSTAQDALG